jgi:hypothetical protein
MPGAGIAVGPAQAPADRLEAARGSRAIESVSVDAVVSAAELLLADT